MPRLRNKILLLVFSMILSLSAYSQLTDSDFRLLQSTSFEQTRFADHKTPFMWVSSGNAILKYNPLSLGFGALMYLYQSSISRHISASCLYSPSCSGFSRELIKDYGLLEGILLTSDRIMRCNRIAAMDIHAGEIDVHDHKVHETTAIYK